MNEKHSLPFTVNAIQQNTAALLPRWDLIMRPKQAETIAHKQ